MLPDALKAASLAGVTRIADVTRLDRIGLPVWQAVRPMSRSLSVHQGKGLTNEQAQLGAILEGLEAHFAESWQGPTFLRAYQDLDEAIRHPRLADFAKDDATPIDPCELVEWIIVPTMCGREIAVPWACVSMDFTRSLRTPFDRSSNGVAVGSSRDDAVFSALLELIERDATTEWKAGSMIDRMSDQIDLDHCPFEWFDAWRDRLASCDAFARCYRVASLTDMPVIACELGDAGKSATPFHAIHGHSAHPDPEIALFRAMAEAVQGRAAYIAGSRDDLMPSEYAEEAKSVRVAFAMPAPASMEGCSMVGWPHGQRSTDSLIDAVQRSGIGPIVVIDLGTCGPFHAVRAMALGLASRKRRRAVVS